MEKEKIIAVAFNDERSLFHRNNLEIHDSVFDKGESPLKHTSDIDLYESFFKYKYPLWYADNIKAKNCVWYEMARAGVWYTDNISLEDCLIEAPKNFRRCRNVSLTNVSFSDAAETLWSCQGVTMKNVAAKGDYFMMNSSDIKGDGLTLYGKYSFDGVKNVEIRNSRLLTKDAFWNSENVTVYDSFISSEYLGWNSRNLTFVNCTIESLQGMCYIDNLVMKNCTFINTTLAFEYSTVDIEARGGITSVFNPAGGTIKADYIEELYLQPDKVDLSKTAIECPDIRMKTDRNPL